ncbi:MFS transporter [Georgenia sp. Z1344]|uniref:MFS transporter n=1 Tax=Georgenia sp. Z1344 TaxID=3416706 RepID=UPI003CF80FBC
MTTPPPTAPRRLWVLYVGGFMGPFGGGMVSTMLPELAEGLGTTVHGASQSITWYLGPFALLLLVSGTLADRWDRATVVRVGYASYAASSVACALVPTLPLFLGARAVQGAANAFLTPVLITLIVAATDRGRVGRALGGFAAAQAAGQALSPLAGGLAAGHDWRIAFVATALAAVVLALLTPSGRPTRVPTAPAAWGALLNPRLGSVTVMAATAQLAANFVVLSAALIATDRFGLPPAQRGLVVVAFGVAGFATARLAGAWADRFGMLAMGAVAAAVLASATFAVQVSPALWLLVLAVALCGATASCVRILCTSLAIASTPTNEAGATSVTQSAQFAAGAAAPAVLPLFAASPAGAGALLAAVVIAGLVVVSLPRSHRRGRGG